MLSPTKLVVLYYCDPQAASVQDVAVDGLAIDLIEPDDLGWANSAQVVGSVPILRL
jgi:hypothetical protein